VVALALAGVLASPLALAACSGDDDDTSAATTSTTVPTRVELTLEAGEQSVESVGEPVTLDGATVDALVATAQRYVDAAIVTPLRGDGVGDDYEALFEERIRAGATGADRAALTEADTPALVDTEDAAATPVRVDALAAGDGTVVLAAATFDVTVTGDSADGPVSVRRSHELTFAPGPDGAWLVTAYRVGAQRDVAGATTTTAATRGSTVSED
jgi:hypothetical protein